MSSPKISTRALAVVLFCITALVFSRSIFGSFQSYDDPDYVINNSHIKNGFTWETVCWAFTTTTAANWHPLTWLSHTLDWSLFGNRPQGHHAINVLLHSINAALAFLVLVRATKAFWASAACAALFALHPLRVESVAWVAERKDVLSVLFWWLALWAYLGYVERRQQAQPSGRWYALTLTTFVLGLLTKPMLVTFPFVLLLLDYWPLNRFTLVAKQNAAREGAIQNDRKSETLQQLLWEKIPFLALTGAACGITFYAQQKHGVVSTDLPFDARLGNATVSIARYAGKFFWPDKLAVFYPHPGYWPVRSVVAASLLVAASFSLIFWRRKRPWVVVGWLWFLGVLVPTVGFVQVGLQSMADRYTYLPSIGLQIGLIWSIADFVRENAHRRLIAGAAFYTWLIALVAVTWHQQSVWKDPFTLFQHAINVTERNYLAWNNLGAAYSEHGRYTEARPFYEKAVELNPRYALAHSNLAGAYAKTGFPDKALKEYEEALALNPELLTAHRGYATSLSDANRFAEALAQHQFILERVPDDLEALNGAGTCLQLLGQNREAEKMFVTALALSPKAKNFDTHVNLGAIYATTGRLDEAVREFRYVLAQSPNYAQAHNNLANALVSQGQLSEAVEHYKQAIAAQPDNMEARYNLGIVLYQLDRFYESRDVLAEAVKLRPEVPALQSALIKVETKIFLLPSSSPTR
ncbi:MAG: tetratricopeptide repeat protein [Nibricoccus sp.]